MTIEFEANDERFSSSVSTSGSGTRSSSASAEAASSADGATIARRSSSGQKTRSKWYIAGCTIRKPRTVTPRSVARCFSASSSVRGP